MQNVSNNGDILPIIRDKSTVQNAPDPVSGMHVSTLDELEAELMADDRVRARIGKIPWWLRLAKWRIKVKRLIRR